MKPPWDPAYNRGLEMEYGSHPICTAEYRCSGISVVNKEYPLSMTKELHHAGSICGLAWSHNGEMLASCSTIGNIQIYDTKDWTLIQTLRDVEEKNIEEYYTLQFTPDDKKLFAAGKLKNRDVWDEDEDDNEILPCPIKLFDVVSGKVLVKLQGHEEEILDIKCVLFRNGNYLLSASQDGHLIKWHLSDDWAVCSKTVKIDPKTSCMILSTAFLPGCGNKYFIAAADEGVKIYDFEAGIVLQAIEGLYTSYCDCVVMVDLPEMRMSKGTIDYQFLSRGVELVQRNQKAERLVSKIQLHRLSAPTVVTDVSKEPPFQHEVLATYTDPRFRANVWPLSLAASGSYVLAPALQNAFFGWNMLTGKLVCVCVDEKAENRMGAIRTIKFHPTRSCVVAAGDTSTIYVYEQSSKVDGKLWYSSHVDRRVALLREKKELNRLIGLTNSASVKELLRKIVREKADEIENMDE